eukprot:1956664-Rhodomonas_salina.1
MVPLRTAPLPASGTVATTGGADKKDTKTSRTTVIIILTSTVGGVLVLSVFGCLFFWAVNSQDDRQQETDAVAQKLGTDAWSDARRA